MKRIHSFVSIQVVFHHMTELLMHLLNVDFFGICLQPRVLKKFLSRRSLLGVNFKAESNKRASFFRDLIPKSTFKEKFARRDVPEQL